MIIGGAFPMNDFPAFMKSKDNHIKIHNRIWLLLFA